MNTIKTENDRAFGNDVLAKFMGGSIVSTEPYEMPHGSHSTGTIVKWTIPSKIPTDGRSLAELGLFKYDSNWDWLWPVIDKIESLGYSFSISRRGIQVLTWPSFGFSATDLIIDNDFLDDYVEDNKRLATWDACVAMVIMLNTNNIEVNAK